MTQTFQIHIQGLVQGVGFRPFIFKLASEMGLKGQVENRNNGVLIQINTTPNQLKFFINSIKKFAPPASNIYDIKIERVDYTCFYNFRIGESTNISNQITEISADIAVCKDCLNDMKTQPHRLAYPFTNCTNCGPRFTIIKNLPYDRQLTTMNDFQMCHVCREEYLDVYNRRFHAQPVACNNCGPKYQLFYKNSFINNLNEIIQIIVNIITRDELLAIKGLGGFHLMCNAYSENAVNKLRNLKIRESKPFAVMCKDFESAQKHAFINEIERDLLISWQRPIVLLSSKNRLADGVQNKLSRLGIMLPYMPFHYQLFEYLETDCVVLTSGNLADEPIVIENDIAMQLFKEKTTAVLIYNRDIYNRTDDSVVHAIDNKHAIIRRSRGYAPSSIAFHTKAEGIFAAGAELVSTFSIGKQSGAILSQHIGDLKNAETYEFYKESFKRFSQLFNFVPSMVAVDLHPDYLSSQFGCHLAENYDIPVIKIQHHHAHTCTVMAEYGLDEKVIGVCFDGVGLGSDNKIWGAEFIIADYLNFERWYHFKEIDMVGADKVSTEPWRSALSYLIADKQADFLQHYISDKPSELKKQILQYLEVYSKKINSISYSSAGRLFDAVSSILNICDVSNFHAEAPMLLESIIDKNCIDCYEYMIENKNIIFSVVFSEIIKDVTNKISKSVISTKFHNTLVRIIVEVITKMKKDTGINKIVLSGGTFQNKYLTERCLTELRKNGYVCYYPQKVPVNDGGISLGQLAIAAESRKYK